MVFFCKSMQLLSTDEFFNLGHQAVLCNYSMTECNILQLLAAYKANCIHGRKTNKVEIAILILAILSSRFK